MSVNEQTLAPVSRQIHAEKVIILIDVFRAQLARSDEIAALHKLVALTAVDKMRQAIAHSDPEKIDSMIKLYSGLGSQVMMAISREDISPDQFTDMLIEALKKAGQ